MLKELLFDIFTEEGELAVGPFLESLALGHLREVKEVQEGQSYFEYAFG